jgi:DNA-binding NtrC family response regulator
MAGTNKPKLLCVESNEQVLSEQIGLFTSAGYQVQSALGRKAAEQAVRASRFDIVVLGHTLSRDDRHHLPYMAKKANQDCAVLVLHASGHHHAVDLSLDSRDGAHKVLEAVAELLATQPVLSH